MTCIFWNVNGKDRTDLICQLVAEKESDVVADEYVAEGKVLIFVLSKAGVEEVAASLRRYSLMHLSFNLNFLGTC